MVRAECFYCHEPGCFIAVCPAKHPTGMGFIKTASLSEKCAETAPEPEISDEVAPNFQPVISQGLGSLTGATDNCRGITENSL